MDRVLAIRQVCEKYLANWKDVFLAFVDLEKAYEKFDWSVTNGELGMKRCVGELE